MKVFGWLALVLWVVFLGCAPASPHKYRDFPTGAGTVPPSFYDYDPVYEHWYDPWVSEFQ